MSPSAPARVPASPSPTRGNGKPKRTRGTSGRSSGGSSPSAAFQWSLESRLRARLGAHGSPEYALIWKSWAMRAGPPICALRASARRTSASDFAGWGTPRVSDGTLSETTTLPPSGTRSRLELEVLLAGWPTPRASDQDQGNHEAIAEAGSSWLGQNRGATVATIAQLAGWPSPSARDWKDSPGMATSGINPDGSLRQRLDQLPRVAALAGWRTPTTGDCKRGAETVRRPIRRPAIRRQEQLAQIREAALAVADSRWGEPGRRGGAGPRDTAERAWAHFDLLPCSDGKARRVEAGTFPLAHGVPGRVGLLRGYGNAIVPQLAAEFIVATLEALTYGP